MRIAFVNDTIYPYSIGGAEIRDWEIAKRLAKRGHKVHIFGMKEWKGKDNFIKEGVHIHGVRGHINRYTKTGRRSITHTLYFSFIVFFKLSTYNFDIIVVANFPYFTSFYGKIISVVKRTYLIAHWDEIWGNYWYKYLGLAGFFGKSIEKIAIKIPDKIITVSNATKKQLIKTGLNEEKIRVIPNGIDPDYNNILPASEKIDVLFAGRLIRDKNVDVLIKAIKLLKNNFQNINCCIIGDGPEKEKLLELATELDLKKNIKFMGFMKKHEDVISLMKSSKVFAFPSTREGFGIVIIEAFYCGLPVIGVNSRYSKCVSELIKDGENGFLLNSADENALAEKILILLKDENLRIKMGNNGKKVAEKYDWNKITDEFEDLFFRIYQNKK